MAKKQKSVGTFYVRARGPSRWYLMHEFWMGGQKQTISIPKNQFSEIGFNPEWTVIEAKDRASRLNKENGLKRGELVRASKRARIEASVDSVFFPEEYMKEFLENLMDDAQAKQLNPTHVGKLRSHFVTIQKLVRELRISPGMYLDKSAKIFIYLQTKRFSLDYSKKLIQMLNRWGLFVSKKESSFFTPVKIPNTKVRRAIKQSQKYKTGVRRAALPLSPEILTKKIPIEFYNWIYLSLWLGLRPSEVDNLKETRFTKLKDKAVGIYQTKLDLNDDDDNWKWIPFIFEEQKKCIDIIQSGIFKRPLTKTMTNYLGNGYSLYSGRKGFESICIDRGQSFENIAEWLGHKNINTTFKHYRQKKKASNFE